MARIFIDLTDDETHWNGEISVRVMGQDSLSGNAMALAIGQHEIVLTINQAITLFDVLDGWLNSGPITEVGAIRRRVIEAITTLQDEHPETIRAAIGPKRNPTHFANALADELKFKGLRFRMIGEQA